MSIFGGVPGPDRQVDSLYGCNTNKTPGENGKTPVMVDHLAGIALLRVTAKEKAFG